MDPKFFFGYPNLSFQEISDPAPDPTLFFSKEAKSKFLNKTAEQTLILKKTFGVAEVPVDFLSLQ